MKNTILTLLLLNLVLYGFSQSIGYEVRGTYKRPIIKEKLIEAKTMSDVNPGFPSSWIKDYISVEVLATCNGVNMKAKSANDTLSNGQMSILKMADMGTDIVVNVKYNPKNSYNSDVFRVINFSYTIVPEFEAEYPGGYQLLKKYLKTNAIDKIPETIGRQLQQTSVRFSINEQGQVTDTQLSKSSGNDTIDQLLLQTINEMQNWKPAENSNGVKVKQEFELYVGTMIGC